MEITVLGKSCAWPDAGGANSSYLVKEGDFTLLLDCGTGVFSKLRNVSSYGDVDAILISHLHADHTLDLIPYSYALLYSVMQFQTRPLLYGPPGFIGLLERFAAAIGFGDQLMRAFQVQDEYQPTDVLELGPLSARFCEVPHFVPAYACDLTTPSGQRFTYGSDCGYNDPLVELATDTDLVILEATLGGVDIASADELSGHMSAKQAGELARAARAGRVVLSHYSDEIDASAIERDGAIGFGAPVALAHEGDRFTV